MNIVNLKTKDLAPYLRNQKKHDKRQIDNVAESIKQFGIVQPIVVDKDNNIIIGHCRLLACQKLEIEEVPVVKLEDLTPEQANKLRLLDNKLNESDWDIDILTEDIPELDFTGFDIDWGLPENITEETKEMNKEDDEENLFDDIEKLEKHYGVPYQGNKSRIADIIVNILPAGERLVDLFGGGGAITHCAMLSNKWNNFLYNDLNSMITSLFMDAVKGKYHDEKRIITVDDFNGLKDTDAYVKYIWSFGNAGDSYLWGKDIRDLKCQACRVLLDDTASERRLSFVKFMKMIQESIKETASNRIELHSLESLEALQRLEALEKLEALQRLEALEKLEVLQRLEVSNINYEDYEYKEGDIVYCDVPYEQAGKKSCNDYGVMFDSIKFYEWCKSKDYQIFFSSYEISDKGFYKVKVKDVKKLMAANNSGYDTEYLYSNKPIISNKEETTENLAEN